MKLRPLLLVIGALAQVAATSCDGHSPPVCTPGETQLCVGPGGCTGGQSCNITGSGFEECLCGHDAGGPTDGGLDAEVPPDAGNDSGLNDAGDDDSGLGDGGDGLDAGTIPDAAPSDGSMLDAGAPDAGPCTVGCEVVELAAGLLHTCARRADGRVLCWGRNEEHQLGDGARRHEGCAEPGGPTVDCSSAPVLVGDLLSADALGSGSSFGGQCGLATSGAYCWGREVIATPLGGLLRDRPTAERLTSLSGVSDLSFGSSHACAVTSAGVQCWGRGTVGQLGTGAVMEQAAPSPVTSVAGAIDVEVGAAFSCARSPTQTWCWGSNRSHELADSTPHTTCMLSATEALDCAAIPVEIAALAGASSLALGDGHGCALIGTAVQCWGANDHGAAGQPTTMSTVPVPTSISGLGNTTQLAAGASHTCALSDGGLVRCWGNNEQGQLGDGAMDHGTTCSSRGSSFDCSTTPVTVGLTGVLSIAAGGNHTCALRMSGEVYCWGANSMRELGDGSRTTRFAPVRTVGL